MTVLDSERVDLGALRANARYAALRARIAREMGNSPRALPSRFQLAVERYATIAMCASVACAVAAVFALRGAPAMSGGDAADWRTAIAVAATEATSLDARDAFLMMRGAQ